MKRCVLVPLIVGISGSLILSAQPRTIGASVIDSLKHEVEITGNDTMRYTQLTLLAQAYVETNPDSSYYYSRNALEIIRRLKINLAEAYTLGGMGYALQNLGNYPASLKTFLSAIKIASDAENGKNIPPPKYLKMLGLNPEVPGPVLRIGTLGFLHQFTGILYENANDFEKELDHLRYSRQCYEEIKDTFNLSTLYYILGRVYLSLQKNDSAFMFLQKAYDYTLQTGNSPSGVLLTLGKYYVATGHDQQAVDYLRSALLESHKVNYSRGVIASSLLLSSLCRKQQRLDSSLYFANSALALAQQMKAPDLLLRSWSELVSFYSTVNGSDSIAKYQALIIQLKDSLFNSKQTQEFQNINFDEQQRQRDMEIVRKAYRDRLQKYGLLAGLVGFFLIATILWRNNRNKQKAYAMLIRQKQETDFQKAKVEQTLDELRSTQALLIQSEKMASLGELTAGIAHEIQNPLNFVTNFSEVNKELFAELKTELKKGNFEEANAIADNIESNEEKINHHGKRADAIVKNMIQHSRATAGVKEFTDINKLADEYLRLAYHGLRGKDKLFNSDIETDFDPAISKLNIVPQDIGRVLLNLINNAFYAVNEKQKQNIPRYEPIVTVSTKKSDGKVEIVVTDNGNGIPQKILDKIFQPFFTTKPTGQGTGLGLSLAYDIITKGYGGEIIVNTKENEGTEFTIVLPT